MGVPLIYWYYWCVPFPN